MSPPKGCFWDLLSTVLTGSACFWLFTVQIGQYKPLGSQGKQTFLAKVDVSGYGNALSVALSDPIFGLYTDNVSTPLDVHAGLRRIYKFGVYRHCAYVNKTNGSCSGLAAGYRFRPFKVITDDMPSNYSDYTDSIIRNTTFANSPSLGRNSHAAYPLLLIGTLLSGLSALLTSWAPYISVVASFIGAIFVLIGATIWTVIIKRAGHINSLTLQPSQIPIGIHVSIGSGLYYVWAAFGCLVASIISLIMSCLAHDDDD